MDELAEGAPLNEGSKIHVGLGAIEIVGRDLNTASRRLSARRQYGHGKNHSDRNDRSCFDESPDHSPARLFCFANDLK